MSGEKPPANRQAKDSVFRQLFRIKKYTRELYIALFPDDTAVTEDDIENITLENTLASREYNDLGFLVRDRLMILAEAQSTWSANTLVRMLIYLLHEYYEYITKKSLNLFSRKRVELPKPYLFIIYTGSDRKNPPADLSLRRDFFGGAETSLELTARVIRDGEQGDIIYQYAGFTRVFNEQIKLHGKSRTAIAETIRICRDKDLLKEYLTAHEREAYNAMQLFTDEFLDRAERLEAYREGCLDTLFGLVSNNMLTPQNAADSANLSLSVFNAMMAEYESRPRP